MSGMRDIEGLFIMVCKGCYCYTRSSYKNFRFSAVSYLLNV